MATVTQKLQPDYCLNRDRLRDTFPAAFEFLAKLESMGPMGVTLSTSVNAHLYVGNKFVAYIRFAHRNGSPTITLSPKYNNKIVEFTVDRSDLLFPRPVLELAARHQVGPSWYVRLPDGAIEIRPSAPASLFSDFIALIATLADGAASSPPTTPKANERSGVPPDAAGDSVRHALATRLAELERENVRLKTLVADLMLENRALPQGQP